MIRIKCHQVLMQFAFKQGIIVVQVFGNYIFLANGFIFYPLSQVFFNIYKCQAKPEKFKFFFGKSKQVKLYILNGIINIDTQLFEIGSDYINAFGLVVFIAKSLGFDTV